MRGWRRNLAFCLQRLPDEGRTRPPPRPVSTGAARGEEGGPSAGLIGGRPLGVPAGGEGRTAVCFPGAGGKRLKRRARRVTAGHAAWSAAGPGGTQRAAAPGARRWDRGPGDGLGLGVGGEGLWTPQGAARDRRASLVLGAAGAGAATTCVPASWPGVGGSCVRALTAAGAWGSRGCRRWDSTFLRAPGSRAATTPESAVPQSCREAGGEAGRGARRAGSRPGPAAAQRRSRLRRPPPRAAPQLTCGRGRWPRGLEVKEDPRPGLATAEGSSASVNCQNGVEGAEPGRDGSAHLRLTSGGTKAGLQAAGTVRPGPHFRLCLSPSRPPLGRALFFPPGQGGH